MSILLSAYLGTASLTGVGYAFYDATETIIGSRVTSGIHDAGDGWYSASATPGSAASVRWNDNVVTTAIAREYFDPRMPSVAAGTMGGLTLSVDGAGGVNTVQFGGSAVVATSGKLWVLDGSGNAVAPASTALSTATWTSTIAGRIDAVVSSRMATYTQPTGFLSATFPTTVASPTNITGGTITTVSGNVSGSVVGNLGGNVAGNVLGNVGSIANVAFPANFATFNIDGAGFVSLAGSQNFDNVGQSTAVPVTLASGAVRTDIGMASANMDTQLANILTAAESGGGGGLSGPSSVTLTFVDASSNPVPNVEFTVLTQGSDRANSSGVSAFGLNDGTYTVAAGPVSGVIFPNSALTVLGATALTITGTANSITPPSNPTLCRVFGYAVTIQGTIAAKVTVGFSLNSSSAAKTSLGSAAGNLIAAFDVNVVSDSTGFFFADLISNQPYIIKASALKFNGFAFSTTAGGTTLDLSTLITT